jgi:hypothetical protein
MFRCTTPAWATTANRTDRERADYSFFPPTIILNRLRRSGAVTVGSIGCVSSYAERNNLSIRMASAASRG